MLRARARRFEEGSVVTIRSGVAAGLRWRRYHRFVNAYWLGNYELDVQLALQRLLQAGDVFYDVGANAGFFTILAGRLVGSGGKVFAFEPLSENVDTLRDQIELNGLPWCEVVPVAVSARSGAQTLAYEQGNNAMAHLGARGAKDDCEIQVQTVTLDGFVAGHPFPSLIKVDVEGAEAEVLEGAASVIRAGADVILELHEPKTAMEADQVFRQVGYHFESLNGRSVERPRGFEHVVARGLGQRTPSSGVLHKAPVAHV
jgi:FkbM family methyltransferase